MTGAEKGDLRDVRELGFEEAYRALEEAVTALERGEMSLDETLALYERGVALADRCSELLVAAELRVRRLEPDGSEGEPIDL